MAEIFISSPAVVITGNPWLNSARRRDLFLSILEQARRRYRFVVLGYVVMPEHFHLLIGEPEEGDPSKVMQVVKQRFAQRVLRWRRKRRVEQAWLWKSGPEHVWQARFYDFNIWCERKRVEKVRYMHRNPVKRGLVNGTRAVGVEQFSRLLAWTDRQGSGE